MPKHPIALNLAKIVHRVMTHRRGWPIEELKNELQVADRTYRKYRKLLTESFSPFTVGDECLLQEVEDGTARYLRLVDGAERPADTETAAHIAALHLTRQALEFLEDTPVGEAISGLAHQLERSARDQRVPRRVLRDLDRLLYHVPDAPKDYWGRRREIRRLLTALFASRRVRLTYEAANSTRGTRTLEPLTLVAHRSALYLLARAPGDETVKTYAVDRMMDVELLEETFEYPAVQDFHPATFTEGSFGIFQEHDGEPRQVELVFTNLRWLKVYLQERRWHPTQRFEEFEDGRLKMTFRVTSMAEVWPWIRSFGTDVEVIRPPGPIPASFSEQEGQDG